MYIEMFTCTSLLSQTLSIRQTHQIVPIIRTEKQLNLLSQLSA